jgi:hypothetical protein
VLHKPQWLREKQAAAAAAKEAKAEAKEARETAMLDKDRYGATDAPEISHKKLTHLSRSKAEKSRPVY